MGRNSGGVSGTKRGSNKYSPTETLAAIKSSKSAMKKAAYINGTNEDRQAAVDKAAAQIRKVAAGMPIDGVEAWHKEALAKAKETETPSFLKTYKDNLYKEVVYRDQMELALRQYLMKKNPKKYNDDWVYKMMYQS